MSISLVIPIWLVILLGIPLAIVMLIFVILGSMLLFIKKINF